MPQPTSPATRSTSRRVTARTARTAGTDQPDHLALVGPHLLSRRARRRADQHMAEWLAEFERHMLRGLAGQGAFDVVDEVVARERLKVIEHFAEVSQLWTPARYARARLAGARAVIDLVRVESAQRGQGAHGTRTVLDLDATLPTEHDAETTLHDLIGADDTGYDTVEARLLLAGALLALTPRQREVAHLVDEIGYSVTEAAARLRITRETASRTLGEARRRLRDALPR